MPASGPASDLVLPTVRPIFRALARTIVPEAARLDERAWADLEQVVERALAARPPSVRRQLRTLIRLLDLLPIARYAHRFTALDPRRRARFLDRVQGAPVLLLRRGLWGLRTLVFMGYYARREADEEIGYRADPRGWAARR